MQICTCVRFSKRVNDYIQQEGLAPEGGERNITFLVASKNLSKPCGDGKNQSRQKKNTDEDFPQKVRIMLAKVHLIFSPAEFNPSFTFANFIPDNSHF